MVRTHWSSRGRQIAASCLPVKEVICWNLSTTGDFCVTSAAARFLTTSHGAETMWNRFTRRDEYSKRESNTGVSCKLEVCLSHQSVAKEMISFGTTVPQERISVSMCEQVIGAPAHQQSVDVLEALEVIRPLPQEWRTRSRQRCHPRVLPPRRGAPKSWRSLSHTSRQLQSSASPNTSARHSG